MVKIRTRRRPRPFTYFKISWPERSLNTIIFSGDEISEDILFVEGCLVEISRGDEHQRKTAVIFLSTYICYYFTSFRWSFNRQSSSESLASILHFSVSKGENGVGFFRWGI